MFLIREKELAKITYWSTDTLKLNDLQHTTNTRVAIKQNDLNNISIYPASISVKIPVDEFTEKTIELPLKVINNTEFLNIKLYPKRVKVTFLVALSNYQEVNEDFIEAVVDVNEWKQLKHQSFTVKITRFPDYCKLINVMPNKINFIIEK